MKYMVALLARRYLFSTRHTPQIRTMASVCFVGIAIGSFALALVAAVMNGFEQTTHEKLLGIQAPITIRSYGNQHIDFEKLATYLTNKFTTIIGIAPHSTQHALITDNESEQQPHVIALYGIDPQREPKVTALHTKLAGAPTLSAALAEGKLIVGHNLADELDVNVGQHATLLIAPDEPTSKKIKLHKQTIVVGGIINTGIEEYDSNVAFCTLERLQELFPDAGITHVGIKLAPNANEDQVIAQLKTHLSLPVYSWRDLYPALVSALKLEKYVMFLILALITLVACTNIIALMFMQITNKRGDIAILSAMGMHRSDIRNVFLLLGVGISMSAALLGTVLAWGTSWLLEHYPFIELPDVYYVSHLPARMEWSIVVAVLVTTLVLSLVATWLPVQRIGTLNISNILRFEA